MDEGMTNYMEYRVAKNTTARDRLKRFIIIFGWSILPLMLIIVGLAVKPLTVLIYMTPVGVMIAIPFGRHQYHMSFIEYEYALVAGVIRMDKIYGSIKRKPWFEAKLSDMTLLAPYEGGYKTKADAFQADIRYEAASSLDSPDVYVGTYRNEEGNQCVLFFEATNKFINLAKFYNRNIVVKQTRF